MKKILSFLIAILIIISLVSCESENINQTINNDKKESETKQQETEKETEQITIQGPTAWYSNYEERLEWDKTPNAISYTVIIDYQQYSITTNTYEYIEEITPGKRRVEIIPNFPNTSNYKAETETIIVTIPGFIQNEAKKKAENELAYSMVTVTVEQYNTFLGIKTESQKNQLTGTICKKNGNTYWVICSALPFSSGKNFDKTKITVHDYYNNEYEASMINPTSYDGSVLKVLSFKSSKSFPVVTFGIQVPKEKEVMFLQQSTNSINTGFVKITGAQKITINGIKTEYDVIKTDYSKNAEASLPVFDQNYDLIGITVREKDSSMSFIQIKEILLYIDSSLAKAAGYTSSVIIP